MTILRGLSILSCLAVFGAPSLAQSVTIAQARATAPLALEQGNLKLASALAQGLIQANAKDITGLIVQASVLQRTGQFDQAINMAKRAMRASNTRYEKYTSATILAGSYFATKAFERSKFWLRIASQNAKSPQQKTAVAQSYKRVRADSPLSTQLQFNVSPSDNVNNGTTEKSFYGCIFGSCGEIDISNSEPLPGLIFQLSGTADYTLSESRTKRLVAGVDLTHQHVELVGKERKTTAYKGSDFNYTFLNGHITDTRLLGTSGVNLRSDLSFGRFWIKRPELSGDTVTARPVSASDRTSLSMSASKVLSQTRRATAGYTATLTKDRDDNFRSSKSLSLRFSDEHILPNNDRLTWSVSGTRSNSQSLSADTQSGDLSLTYAPSKRIKGISASFSASLGWRQDKRFNNTLRLRRKDKSLSLRGRFTANDISFYGFSPVTIIEAERTTSNNVRFNSQSVGMSVNFVTSF